MPTYDYLCEKDHRFELFHGIKDESPKVCPKCGSPAKRVPAGGGGLLFKGSGFYITDYRSRHYKDRAKADKSPGSSGSGEKPSGGSPGGGSAGASGGSGGSGGSSSPPPSGGSSPPPSGGKG